MSCLFGSMFQYLKRKGQKALYEVLTKLEEGSLFSFNLILFNIMICWYILQSLLAFLSVKNIIMIFKWEFILT